MAFRVDFVRKLLPHPVSYRDRWLPGDYDVPKAFLVAIGHTSLLFSTLPTHFELVVGLLKVNPGLSLQAARQYAYKMVIANHIFKDLDRAWQLLDRAVSFQFIPRRWHEDAQQIKGLKERIAFEFPLQLIPSGMATAELPESVIDAVESFLGKLLIWVAEDSVPGSPASRKLTRALKTMLRIHRDVCAWIIKQKSEQWSTLCSSVPAKSRSKLAAEALANLYVNTFEAATTTAYSISRHTMHELAVTALLGDLEVEKSSTRLVWEETFTKMLVETLGDPDFKKF